MASYSQTRLVYTAVGTGAQYIDLTKGLALVNQKNCTQFRKDKPIIVGGTIRLESAAETVKAAQNTWVVRNACVKAGAAWKRTLRSAGIRSKRKLNTYGKEMRLAMDEDHAKTYGGSLGASSTKVDAIPDGCDDSYNTGVYDSSGTEIVVYSTLDIDATGGFSATKKRSFTQTTFAVPQSGSTDVLDKPANLLDGLDSVYCNVVAEYIDSRINDADIEDTDMDDTPSNDNDFVMMLAPGEEVADDVLDNVDDEGKWRPYTLNSSLKKVDVIVPGANVAGQDTFFEAPLGLLRWSPGSNGNQMVVDISYIQEM
jgi:hypothetical protein